ncbi:MAG: sulfate ABC transporter substrate-binding protein, partial [Candidatus Nitrosopolaris sp.]
MTAKIKLVISAAIIAGVIASSLLYSNPGLTISNNNNNNNSTGTSSNILRIGYFPILNHAQAVIGMGNGDFQKALGANIVVKPLIFDSGP